MTTHAVADARQSTQWLNWSDVPARFPSDDGSRLLELMDHLASHAASATAPAEFLKQGLMEAAGELGAQTAAVVERTPEWRFLAQHGRWNPDDLPWSFFVDALDRDAIGQRSLSTGQVVVAPLQSQSSPTAALLFAGRTLPDDLLPQAALVARGLGWMWDVVQRQSKQQRKIAQLRGVLGIAAGLAGFPEVEPLLEKIAVEATQLLDCDRASIFLWDRERQELVARPALGIEGGSLRLPDTTGIVGEVLRAGKPARVEDAYADVRFSRQVDQASGYLTRNLMCMPLFGANRQLLGVFEVINKLKGSFDDDDEDLLRELSAQVAAVLFHNPFDNGQTKACAFLAGSHIRLREAIAIFFW